MKVWIMFLSLGFLILNAPLALASGGGEAKEEKKEGEAAEGEKKEGQVAAPVSSKEAIEYNKKEARLNTLKSRITEAEEKFKGVLEAKERAKDKKQKQDLALELIQIAKDRNENVKEYSTLRHDLRYRYPNKGEEIDRRYIPQQEKSLHELSQTSALDEQLTAAKKRMDKKYAPLMPPPEEAPELIVPQKKDDDSKKKLRLVK